MCENPSTHVVVLVVVVVTSDGKTFLKRWRLTVDKTSNLLKQNLINQIYHSSFACLWILYYTGIVLGTFSSMTQQDVKERGKWMLLTQQRGHPI